MGREERAGLASQLSLLDAALGRLNDEQRIVVLLHDAEGYSLEEIEQVTGTPVGTVKSRLHRILEDGNLEGDESFTVSLFGATGGASIGPLAGSQPVIIVDNERGFRLLRSTLTVGEAGGTASPEVRRNGDLAGAVSVDYSTASGSATAGADFTAATGTLNWADGDSSVRNIVVNITNDTTDESDETFTVMLSNPSAGMLLGFNTAATVTITDDDASAGGGGGGGGGGGALGWLTTLWLSGLYLLRRRTSTIGRSRHPAPA